MNNKNRIVIYTAIFGGSDTIVDPIEVNKECDYVCFTDSNIKSSVYTIVRLDNFFETSRMDSKLFKILPNYILSNYDISIWIDGSVVIKKDPIEYFKKQLIISSILTFKHSLRDCLYEEAAICRISGLDSKEKIDDQINYYKNENFPVKAGLFEAGVLARLNNDAQVLNMNVEWWNQIRRFSSRDQISLPYVLNTIGLVPGLIPGTVYENEFFEVRKHNGVII